MPIVTTHEALLSGYTWNGINTPTRPTFLTFSFDAAASATFAGSLPQAFLDSFRALSAVEQDIVRQALKIWADASGLTLFEVPAGQGDIRIGTYNFAVGPEDIEDSAAFAYNPFVLNLPDGAWEEDFGGDIFFDYGQVDLETALHEIGHALGLKHPFEGSTTLDRNLDNTGQTVMSYVAGSAAVTGLGPLDIAAIQQLYGGPDSDGTHVASWSWDAQAVRLTQAGGPGNDTLAGVAVADRITAGAGNDYVMARGGADTIDGGDGNDTLAGGDGNDTVAGGFGDDIVDGDNGDDSLTGGAGNDELWGMNGADTLAGEEGDDTLNGGAGANRLMGGVGDDVIVVSSGLNTVDGGEGYDEIWFSASSSAGVLLSYANLTAGGGSFINIESVVFFGGAGADTIQGGSLHDVLLGAQGADSLAGGAGDDILFGDTGADTLAGGEGDDLIDGWSGDDWIIASGGADEIYGGTGIDTLDFSGLLSGVNVAINTRNVIMGASQVMAEMENMIGTPYGDHLKGDGGDNRIFGGGGNDTVIGGDGANYLRGDEGNDSLMGGAGFDDINGNMGDDTASGGLGDDWVVGGKDQDRLFGDEGDDIVYGNLGDDTLDGGPGNDVVRGGQGNDTLTGGAGNDFMSGDRGDDTVAGGAGADIFHIFAEAGIERVLDFNLAEGDRVMLAPGSQYTVSQVGADTVISLVGGAQMILVGVAMSGLTGDWIFGA
ncbi:matrixin family metalloprotease [Phenylobacterium sp.]|uniref:matrixin family metalloprotease n=1 Tax=Phenylobacterium sp. TaxID=1871053 RepID=UPI00301CAF0E